MDGLSVAPKIVQHGYLGASRVTQPAIADSLASTSLAPSPDLELPTEPAEPKPSADAAALRSTPQGYLQRRSALARMIDEKIAALRPEPTFRRPQHDLDASRKGRARFWTWCACGHVYTIPGECATCQASL